MLLRAGELTGADRDISARGYLVAVDEDRQSRDAVNAGDREYALIDSREQDRPAEGPPAVVVSSAQRVEVLEQGALDVLLHLREVGGVLDDDLGMDLDVTVRRRDDVELGREQAAHVEVRADRSERALARHRTRIVAVGHDDDRDDAGYLHAGEVGMREGERLRASDRRRLHGERFEILSGYGPAPALDRATGRASWLRRASLRRGRCSPRAGSRRWRRRARRSR